MPPGGLASDLALAHAIGVANYDRYVGCMSQFTAVEVEACARAYQRLIEDPALRAEMGASGKARAKSLFDWSVVVRAYQKVWNELAEVREKAKELCPRAQHAPANPLRDDPTAIFGHYASGTLRPDTLIRATNWAQPERLKEIQSSAMNTLGKDFLYPPKEVAELITRLSVDEPATVQSLCSNVTVAQGRALLYTLVWLAKMGVVEVGDMDQMAR